MSRNRAGWGFGRLMEKIHRTKLPKSETAGVNKYDPKTAKRDNEKVRRLKQLERLSDKEAKKRVNYEAK